MSEENYDDIYDVEENLGPEIDFEIKEAEFGYNTQSTFPDSLRLLLKGTSSINGIASPTEREISVGFGSKWTETDGVAKSETETGKFHANSGIGKWIKSLGKNVPGIKGYLGDPRIAGNWVGKGFHLKPVKTGERDDGTPRYVYLPSGLIGQESVDVAASVSAVDDSLRAELTELAKSSDSHDEFIMAALDLDGVKGNSAVEKLVADDGEGSLWALARA